MIITSTLWRRRAREACRAAAVLSVCMLALSVWTLVVGGRSPAAAAATGQGPAAMSPETGDSGTPFTLGLPQGAKCPGDSATDGYRWQTFLVPSSADLSTMQFNSIGPVGGTALTNNDGDIVVSQQTDITTATISGIPPFTWQYTGVGEVSAGVYSIGIACSLGADSVSYWSATVTVTESPSGGPAQFEWAASAPTATTTSTSVVDSTTTTTADGTTTTTLDPGTTTTTTADATTTTTLGADVSGSDVFGGGGPSAASAVSPIGQLPYTGSSPLPIVWWGVFLVVFGRMAMLLGKKPKVVQDGPPG